MPELDVTEPVVDERADDHQPDRERPSPIAHAVGALLGVLLLAAIPSGIVLLCVALYPDQLARPQQPTSSTTRA